MRLANLFKSISVVGVSVALLTGCNLLTDSSDSGSTSDDSWESNTDLISEYGGYEFTDEADAFADPQIEAVELEESMSAAADSDSVPSVDAFAVRILWGQLEGNRELDAVTDWAGSFAVSGGRLAVLRTIAFERRTDRLLPRSDRQTVEFTSMTRPHFDGLLLLIHVDETATDAMLTMATAAYQNSWSLEELRAANLVLPVDDLGNAVSVTGIEIPADPACAGGAVRGHWLQRDGERGLFRGVWMSALGAPVGHIRGHFGINEDGERVWFGKIIGRGGRLIGLARGTFTPSEDPGQPGGTFSGAWAARAGERSGEIAGHYVPARVALDAAAGFFHARWRTNCGDDTTPDEGTVL